MISKNNYIDAVFKLMLFSAGVHMIILFSLAFWKGDPSFLNYFKILSLDMIFPSIGKGTDLTSAVVVILIYLFFVKFLKNK